MGAIIKGVGVYVPENILTNADLEKLLDTNDEWVTSRTGIKQRHILPKDSTDKTSDLGTRAAKIALDRAGMLPTELDGIINGSINPDKLFPATACYIQNNLGAKGFAFDVTAACAGFVYALSVASAMISSGQAKNILVVGSETMSRVVDWTDRGSAILFGDGAGAVVLSKNDDPKRGILRCVLETDGSTTDILYLNNQYNINNDPYLRMNGQSVFKMAVSSLSKVVRQALELEGLTTADLKYALFHQANIRILKATAEKLGLTEAQCPVNVHNYGNTSAASVPLILNEVYEAGKLSEGDLISLAAIGGGMSWGCNLLRW